jgi:hypothetical protein
LWPSFETRAILRGARPSGARAPQDDVLLLRTRLKDMIPTSKTQYFLDWSGAKRGLLPNGSSHMARKLPPIHPGEILREEFLVPLKLTPYAVAAALNVPRTRIERTRH